MTALLWDQGRFAWPFIVFVVWFVAELVAADLSWRIVSMRSVKLATYLGGTWLVGVALIVALAWHPE
jgi:hypothetical protein